MAIISLFASYVPFQQARLSHYGGGKSSLNENTVSFPSFLGSELGMNYPPQSQTTILSCLVDFSFCAWINCMGGWLVFVWFF